jgi:alcohol dehydrogenase YqhD (iron-dependent ADH family)
LKLKIKLIEVELFLKFQMYTKAQPIYESRKTNITASEFWQKIADLNWVDKSEGFVIFNPIKLDDRVEKFAKQFKVHLNNIINIPDIDEESKKNIISHIIARGRDFYNAITDNPSFADYLINEHYCCKHYRLNC